MTCHTWDASYLASQDGLAQVTSVLSENNALNASKRCVGLHSLAIHEKLKRDRRS